MRITYSRFNKFGYEIKGFEYLISRFYRSISVPIARKLSHYSISPEIIVTISMVTVFLSAYFYTNGGKVSVIVGGLLLLIAWILDYVDGDLARLQNRVSNFGEWFDSLVGKLNDVIILPCICFGLYKQTYSINVWLLGFIIEGGTFLSIMLNNKIKLMKIKKNGTTIFCEKYTYPIQRGLLKTILHEATAGNDIVFYVIILGSIFNFLVCALYFSAIYIAVYSIVTIFSTCRLAHSLDQNGKL